MQANVDETPTSLNPTASRYQCLVRYLCSNGGIGKGVKVYVCLFVSDLSGLFVKMWFWNLVGVVESHRRRAAGCGCIRKIRIGKFQRSRRML